MSYIWRPDDWLGHLDSGLAAIMELPRHGGTKRDVELLRTELDKRRNGKPDDVVREWNADAQSGDIPE